MRRKGHPHGRLSNKEKIFFTKKNASIAERRRERKRRRKINLGKKEETESAEYGHAA